MIYCDEQVRIFLDMTMVKRPCWREASIFFVTAAGRYARCNEHGMKTHEAYLPYSVDRETYIVACVMDS
jgi:hypothetical protein